jgi:hypothetical protein
MAKPETERQMLLAGIIALGVLCVYLAAGKSGSPVKAADGPWASRNFEVIVVPIQLERDSYGLAMVDTVEQTLWIYGLGDKGTAYNRLKLLAARSWRYDRLLQQYNTAEPKPEQVKAIIETLSQTPKKEAVDKTSGSDVKILEVPEPNIKKDVNDKSR